MKRTIAIIHFNTPELTRALIRSVRKHTPGCEFVVFDNSDRRPFKASKGVKVYDNTHGEIIDFRAVLARYPGKRSTMYYHASAKHILSVDWLFDKLTDGFVLLDSDVLVKQDIAPFFDESVPWAGAVEIPLEEYKTVRLCPYLLWINVPMLQPYGIRFKSEGRIYKLSHRGSPYYDTGGSFFEDCIAARLDGKRLDIYDYINHFGSASYNKTDSEALAWLEQNKNLYE